LKDFFANFRAEHAAKLEAVSIEMFGAYIKTVIDAAPKANQYSTVPCAMADVPGARAITKHLRASQRS